jgi:anti-sigma factor RsiW
MHPTNETINDYVDGVLRAETYAEVEHHLQTCPQCTLLVAELQHVIRAAGALSPVAPPAHVWPRLESRLHDSSAAETGQRAESNGQKLWAWRRQPWLAGLATAAAVLIMAIVGLRFAGPIGRSSQPSGATADTGELARSVESELREAEGHYQKAIAGLQLIADAEKGALDPATAATLQKNLAVIDQAIDESRTALKADPNSGSAQASLLEGLKAKVTLLQDAVGLINDLRPGPRG